MNGKLTTYKEKVESARGLFRRMGPDLAAAFGGEDKAAMRMARVALTACQKTPKLLECTAPSLAGAVLTCAQMGLVPDGRQAALVPFYNGQRKAYEATLIPMYQGLVQVAYRSGQVRSVSSAVIFENDRFSYRGASTVPEHEPYWLVGAPEPGKALGAWACITTVMGGHIVEAMSATEIGRIKDRSRSGSKKDSPWNHPDDWRWMWRKTALRAACKMAPQSYELQRALTLDDEAETGTAQTLDRPAGLDDWDEGADEEQPTPVKHTEKPAETPQEPSSEPEPDPPDEDELKMGEWTQAFAGASSLDELDELRGQAEEFRKTLPVERRIAMNEAVVRARARLEHES